MGSVDHSGTLRRRYPLACKHVMRVIHCAPDAVLGAYMVHPSFRPPGINNAVMGTDNASKGINNAVKGTDNAS